MLKKQRSEHSLILHCAQWTVSMQVSHANLHRCEPSAESLGSHVEKKHAIDCTRDSLTCSH